jgi:hypothetical protein
MLAASIITAVALMMALPENSYHMEIREFCIDYEQQLTV